MSFHILSPELNNSCKDLNVLRAINYPSPFSFCMSFNLISLIQLSAVPQNRSKSSQAVTIYIYFNSFHFQLGIGQAWSKFKKCFSFSLLPDSTYSFLYFQTPHIRLQREIKKVLANPPSKTANETWEWKTEKAHNEFHSANNKRQLKEELMFTLNRNDIRPNARDDKGHLRRTGEACKTAL